jgi:hypothetical protein
MSKPADIGFINWEPSLSFDPTSPAPFAAHGIPIPTYGNYGGPGYTAGILGGTTPYPPNPLPPPVDALDQLFYNHDLVFQQVRDGVLNPAAIGPANVDLLLKMSQLTYTDPGAANYDPAAGLSEGLSTLGLVGQLAESGALQALPTPVLNAIAAAAQEAVTNVEAGLAAIPGEAGSLHGALHVFEHKFAHDLPFDLSF